jgi:hypothetical protein
MIFSAIVRVAFIEEAVLLWHLLLDTGSFCHILVPIKNKIMKREGNFSIVTRKNIMTYQEGES